jgi:hypothetical protein
VRSLQSSKLQVKAEGPTSRTVAAGHSPIAAPWLHEIVCTPSMDGAGDVGELVPFKMGFTLEYSNSLGFVYEPWMLSKLLGQAMSRRYHDGTTRARPFT